MATPEQIQDRIDAIDEAIGSGVLTVTHNGKTMTYRSIDELRRARAALVSQLAGGKQRYTYLRLEGR